MHLLRVIFVAVMLFAVNVVNCQSKTIRVPADYPTIQAAINAASFLTSDTVLVSNGTYFENLNFAGKAVTVTSVNGPQETIIDGSHAGPVVNFSNGEGAGSVINGFTIQNGYNWLGSRSEEHTSELQSLRHLVCRL